MSHVKDKLAMCGVNDSFIEISSFSNSNNSKRKIGSRLINLDRVLGRDSELVSHVKDKFAMCGVNDSFSEIFSFSNSNNCSRKIGSRLVKLDRV